MIKVLLVNIWGMLINKMFFFGDKGWNSYRIMIWYFLKVFEYDNVLYCKFECKYLKDGYLYILI